MHLKDITADHRELLRVLSGRISNRLTADFTELPARGGPNVGIELRERGKRMVMELPAALLFSAGADVVAREKLRVRIKAGRDRMLFRPGPGLPERLEATPAPSFGRGSGPDRHRR
jgi:hypothetical protein